MTNRLLQLGLLATAVWSVVLVSQTKGQELTPPYAFLASRERIERLHGALRDGDPAIRGELLVKFRANTHPVAQARALSVLRRAGDSRSRWIGDVLLVDTPGEPNPEAAAAMLARQPEIEWAQPNHLRRLRVTPNDPDYTSQWNLEAIGMPQAWDINPGAQMSITVAVVDTGITATTQTFGFRLWTGSRFETVAIPFRANPDIAEARILTGRDFVFWDGPVLDMNGHGSHVAGTILQETNNSVGPAGIAYAAKLLPLKACFSYWDLQILYAAFDIPGFADPELDGVCDDADIAQAVRYAADQGAQIINVSLGSSESAPVLLEAVKYAVARGAFVALSAGNAFEEGNAPDFPAAYATDIKGAVAVAAVGRSLRRAYYSNTGSYVELAAPGGDRRDGGSSGLVVQTTLVPTDADPARTVRPRFDRYASVGYQGTSMAAPHVAGAAALLYSQGITSPAAIEAALEQFATDAGAKGRDNDFGFGIIAPRAALRGMGLVK
jgi:serine protease